MAMETNDHDIQAIYDREAQLNGNIFHIPKDLAREERFRRAQRIPLELNESRLRTKSEDDNCGWLQMTEKENHYIVTKEGPVPDAAWADPSQTLAYGIMPTLLRLQQLTLPKDLKAEQLEEASPAYQEERKGGAYEMACSVQIGQNKIQLGTIARERDPARAARIQEINTLVAEVSRVVISQKFPELAQGIWRDQWVKRATMNLGHHDNIMATSLQANLSIPNLHNMDLAKSITPRFGGPHVDLNDDPLGLTVVIFLGHLPSHYFVGRFNICDLKVYCPTPAFSILIFRGRHLHFGSGVGPYTSPPGSFLRYTPPPNTIPQYATEQGDEPGADYYQRTVLVAYPTREMREPKSRRVNRELLDFNRSKAFWGTQRNLFEWRLRLWVRIHKKNSKELQEMDADKLCNDFRWTDADTGVVEMPRRELAVQALALAKTSDEPWERLKKAIGDLDCVTRRDTIVPEWLDRGPLPAFNTLRDDVPQNPQYRRGVSGCDGRQRYMLRHNKGYGAMDED